MTTSASRNEFPANYSTLSPSPLQLCEPGELLAAVPALMSFHPRRSVLAVCLRGQHQSTVGLVMRHDLLLGGPDTVMTGVLNKFAMVAEREGATAIVMVFVDDRIGEDLSGSGSPGIREEILSWVLTFDDALAHRQISLVDVLVTSDIAAGTQWGSLAPGGQRGFQPDARDSAVTAAHVLSGRTIHRSREELEHVVAPECEDVRRQIGTAIDDLRARTEPLSMRDMPGHRVMVENLLAAVKEWESSPTLDVERAAQLGFWISHKPVRDAALAFPVGALAAPAESLWLQLTRMLPDRERAEAATLLGFSAYIRGDGPLAGVALDVALRCDPTHVLAGLHESALRHGMRPSTFSEIADAGFECGEMIGVELPARIL
ncbi:MAG: DUF4192 domain-containing protein [Rhodococcus sp.]|nr:DUF4192 domain-containing protein [Rhodococcus sp. (in: high G+C Gram-positive bacteria)]